MGIKLNQSDIKEEDRQLAIDIKHRLQNGQMVIGNPGLGLSKTLSELKQKIKNRKFDETEWETDDIELIAQIAKTEAGLQGEKDLCSYLARLIKYDDDLDGLVAFASLSYEQENNNLSYIPDTDTLLVYGNNILVIDAKNLKLKKGVSISIEDGVIIDSEKGKEILEVHQSTHIWENVCHKANIELDSIDGLACIVSKTIVPVIRNQEWYYSHTKPIHIAELKSFLHEWIQGKDNTINLKLLTEIAKAEIKEEKTSTIDIDNIKRQFGI